MHYMHMYLLIHTLTHTHPHTHTHTHAHTHTLTHIPNSFLTVTALIMLTTKTQGTMWDLSRLTSHRKQGRRSRRKTNN